ncbi:MAG TPA: mechanosensitive ion channel family protein [Actinomycetota bacterium]
MELLAQARDPFTWDQEGVRIAAIVAVALVVTLVSRLLVHRFRRRLEGSPSVTQVVNLQRATTLTRALGTAAVVVIWAIALLLVLGELEINLAPLLASAGVAGVALGFGAQSLVKDTLSGFFILLENQFGVGDVIEVQTTATPVTGKVEDLTLRVTALRAFDGTLHIVPNGNVVLVSNRSKGWGRAIVDVRIAYDEDVDRVRSLLDELFDEIEKAGLMDGWLTQRPSVLGVETLSDYGVVVRVVADTRASKRWDAERRLREQISTRLAREGVRVPLPPTMTQRAGEAGL